MKRQHQLTALFAKSQVAVAVSYLGSSHALTSMMIFSCNDDDDDWPA